jgi:hypothetical protein
VTSPHATSHQYTPINLLGIKRTRYLLLYGLTLRHHPRRRLPRFRHMPVCTLWQRQWPIHFQGNTVLNSPHAKEDLPHTLPFFLCPLGRHLCGSSYTTPAQILSTHEDVGLQQDEQLVHACPLPQTREWVGLLDMMVLRTTQLNHTYARNSQVLCDAGRDLGMNNRFTAYHSSIARQLLDACECYPKSPRFRASTKMHNSCKQGRTEASLVSQQFQELWKQCR